jgi:hypothetical protein
MRTSIGLVDSFITGHETAELIVLSDDFPPEDDDVSVSVVQRVVQTEDAGVERVLALHHIRHNCQQHLQRDVLVDSHLARVQKLRCKKRKGHSFLSAAFPMFVPILSWLNDHFYVKRGQKVPFSDLRSRGWGRRSDRRCGRSSKAAGGTAPAKNGICEPFMYKNDHFANTGSGQT